MISLNLGEKWIRSLCKQLFYLRRNKQKELNKINDNILYSDPLDLAKVYIEPFCQEVNPADRHDEDFFITKEPLFKKISEFLKLPCFQQGNNQLFILSDAGMGKTSSLVMIKLLELSSFWPKQYSCFLEKLNPDTLINLSKIDNKRHTILLLDSLDEDPSAYERVKDRLLELLTATKSFYKVIITCRTQFFPEIELDPLEIPGRIKVGPFICPSKYLSIFDDKQVVAYLLKRFPKKFLWDVNLKKREKANGIISCMGSLRCRPMLLSFIEDLVDSPQLNYKYSQAGTITDEYLLYNYLVINWLLREQAKTGLEAYMLLSVCSRLAFEMQSRRLVKISLKEMEQLIEKFESIENIKKLDITGRSLLNRNSDGDYRFSHYSIQEFLVVYFILEIASLKEERTIFPTDFIKRMLESNKEKISVRFEPFNLKYQDIIEAKNIKINGHGKQDFLSEKEIIELLSDYSDKMEDFDIKAFQQDFDVPTYIRKIILRHVKNKEPSHQIEN